jgi:hypothetical protein
MPLSRGIRHAFSPRAKEIAAKQLDLTAQLLDSLAVFFDRLIVKLRRLIERGSEVPKLLIEILNLLRKPVQQTVTFARISRP